jgi:hypothetical protein
MGFVGGTFAQYQRGLPDVQGPERNRRFGFESILEFGDAS